MFTNNLSPIIYYVSITFQFIFVYLNTMRNLYHEVIIL
jgi:hypothetical protein